MLAKPVVTQAWPSAVTEVSNIHHWLHGAGLSNIGKTGFGRSTPQDGIEPSTLTLTAPRSNHLSYRGYIMPPSYMCAIIYTEQMKMVGQSRLKTVKQGRATQQKRADKDKM